MTDQETPARGGPMRIATWNVHRCVGAQRRRDPARVAEVLREIDAAVVALQEVDTSLVELTGEAVPEFLARSVGAALVLGGTCRVTGSGYTAGECEFGNAILARGEILQVHRIDLSRGSAEPRGALGVDLRVQEDHVRVLTTHLGLRAAERRAQITHLLQATSDLPLPRADRAPTAGQEVRILMGDLNEWRPHGRNIRRLERVWGAAPALRTYPSWWPLLALDRIWVSPRAALQSVRVHDTRGARRASDHLPVVGEIVWST